MNDWSALSRYRDIWSANVGSSSISDNVIYKAYIPPDTEEAVADLALKVRKLEEKLDQISKQFEAITILFSEKG